MSEDTERHADLTARLARLIETDSLSEADRGVAAQCLRRLGQPLRVTVFGTDPAHAIELVNLMVGQPILPPGIERGRIQVTNGPSLIAQAVDHDGTKRRIDGPNIGAAFEGAPARVRVYDDLPVLKKLSILIATDADPALLAADAAKTIPPADITLWAGATFFPQLDTVWQAMPDVLRDHSYLVLSPAMDPSTWASVSADFVDVLTVDPRAAQAAKSASSGVDKAAFKAAGGTDLVKAIKKEIDMLVQSASDAAEVLCARYAESAAPTPAASTPEPDTPESDPAPAPSGGDDDDFFASRMRSTPLRQQVYSVPLGKLASRSRLLNKAAQDGNAMLTQREVSLAMKNMPKSESRQPTKAVSRARPVSRRIRTSATPWSLDL